MWFQKTIFYLGIALAISSIALADSPPVVNTGVQTYIPKSAQPNITMPFPSTATTKPQQPATATPPSEATPDEATQVQDTPIPGIPAISRNVRGRFETKDGRIRVAEKLLNRLQQSVVQVVARDHAGNELGRAMGVAVGKAATGPLTGHFYIATSLSLILGNSVQWADKIEIIHNSGNKYFAKIIFINEALNLVLLDPENQPDPIHFSYPGDERPQIDIYTISFGKNALTGKPEPKIHKGYLSAINPQQGTLSISGDDIDEAQVGTGIIDVQGQLIGMLLPDHRGILGTALANAVLQAKRAKSFAPQLIGMIMGHGVLVDAKTPGAFPNIESALSAIAAGKAPKPDLTRFIPATKNSKNMDRIIIKVATGVYKIKEPLLLPNDISFTGSGPKETVLIGEQAKSPVISVIGKHNISISNLRFVPSILQNRDVATVEISKSRDILFLGNLVESKGGVGLLAENSQGIAAYGNSFPRGSEKAIVCRSAIFTIEANSFLGNWPEAVNADKGCFGRIQRNLFIESEIGIGITEQAARLEILNNTFIDTPTGLRFYGNAPQVSVVENLFYQGIYSIYTSLPIDKTIFKRNGAYKNIPVLNGRHLHDIDMIRAQPVFENAEKYDFRLKLITAQAGLEKSSDTSYDIGAYQRDDYVGKYTSYFMKSLETALNERNLAKAWNYEE